MFTVKIWREGHPPVLKQFNHALPAVRHIEKVCRYNVPVAALINGIPMYVEEGRVMKCREHVIG